MSVTQVLIYLNLLVSIYAFYKPQLISKLAFHPSLMNGGHETWRFFSYAFVHANWIHLAFNMYALYIFGNDITEFAYKMVFESKGRFYYVLLYIGGIITSVIPSFEFHKNNPAYSAVGASGAVSAVVFASILFNPLMKLNLMFIPIDIPAYIFGLLYLIFSYVMAKKGSDRIGHDAHLFGALFGLMFTIILDRQIAVRFAETIKQVWINS